MTKERFGSLFLIAVGLYAMVHSLQLPMGEWNQPGPGVFPLILSVLLAIIGCSLYVVSDKGPGLNWKDTFFRQPKVWAIVGLTAGFILCFDWLGFVPTTALYLFVLFLGISRLSFLYSIALSLGITGAAWFFFVKTLNLHLPPGLWRF